MVSISDLQQRMLEAFSWASRGSFSNMIGRGHGARSSVGKLSKNKDLIHRMARSSLAPKYHTLYLAYKAMYPKFPGYITKTEVLLPLAASFLHSAMLHAWLEPCFGVESLWRGMTRPRKYAYTHHGMHAPTQYRSLFYRPFFSSLAASTHVQEGERQSGAGAIFSLLQHGT